MYCRERAPAAARCDQVNAIALLFSLAALLAPAAHALELPNKMALDAPLWLAVQQNLYRGWGPFVGAPTEIGAFFCAAFCAATTREPIAMRLWSFAALCYAAMLAVFFVFNAPVNAAIASWTVATIPSDWQSWRGRWEAGHAIAAALALAGLAAAIAAALRARERAIAEKA